MAALIMPLMVPDLDIPADQRHGIDVFDVLGLEE